MGKRKERRLAALNGSNRRVKLDLFAEPSGDLGGSSVHDEAGGDRDPKHGGGLPNSPSSSENPLLLLGQYSDDELDEGSSKGLPSDVVDDSSNGQASFPEEPDVAEANGDDNSAAQKIIQEEQEGLKTDSGSPEALHPNVEGGVIGETDVAVVGKLPKGAVEAVSFPGTSGAQLNVDLVSGWKLVMDEVSNQYYYWNIETGETSWEVPDAAQGSALTTISLATHESNLVLDEGYKNYVIDDRAFAPAIGQNELKNADSLGNELSIQHSSYTLSGNENLTSADSDKYRQGLIANMETEKGFDLSGIVKYGECLLGRLKSLEGQVLQGHDWISKFILEVEIRLSDLTTLISYGSSLLPFWVHSESRLKRLEAAINDCEQMNGFEKEPISSSLVKDNLQESQGKDSEANVEEDNDVISMSEKSPTSHALEPSKALRKDSTNEASFHNIVEQEYTLNANVPEGKCNGTVLPADELHSREDMDMDVDMEVEDTIPETTATVRDASSAQYFTPPEQFIQPIPPVEYQSSAPDDEFIVPPPPEEEWIPPPPPDNEMVPPPPPDEPPEPPSYSESVQPLPYTEQYNVSYPDSSFEYYGHAITEVPSNTYYGPQISEPHPQLYHEAVPTTYPLPLPLPLPVPMSGNSIAPIVYSSLPIVSNIDSSVVHHEPVPVSYDTVASVDTLPQIGYTEVGPTDVSATFSAAEFLSADVRNSTTIQVPPLVSVKEESVSGTSDTSSTVCGSSSGSAATVSATAAAAAATAKTKVLRSKKRTIAVAPSLRSNKKVSSLVDKWKAAKEELHEEDEEDDPENAYEILEKKRLKEIEEWRAQQIASGEARDNANFQPVRGDWRERVKRKRAQLKKEGMDNPPKETTLSDGAKHDLTEISRDLPSGWQAYWDESSKQVYYGNALTSETRWDKPTK